MPSVEAIEAELAIKTTLVEALNDENEQLRNLLQRHADAADARVTQNLDANDFRRDSNVHELQTVITHMRAQLYERVVDNDTAQATLTLLRKENAALRAAKLEMEDEVTAMKSKVGILSEQLVEATVRYQEEHQKVATLRAGMDESKRAISIMKDQPDRRNSLTANHHQDLNRRGSIEHPRKVSIVQASPNVSEARRGSLNYLSGLGLTSQRLRHFDPRKSGGPLGEEAHEQTSAWNPGSSMPVSAGRGGMPVEDHNTSAMNQRRASLPLGNTGAADAPLDAEDDSAMASCRFGATTRRSSMTASRRGSMGLPDGVQVKRNSSLIHCLNRSAIEDGESSQEQQHAPLSRRGSLTLLEKRRASLQLQQNIQRRGSDKPLLLLSGDNGTSSLLGREYVPPTVFEDDGSEARSPASSYLARQSTYPPRSEPDGLVQALSLEAAMEISGLKDAISELKMQLMEAEESREASEACARALREFIASSAASEPEHIKLPPLPSDSAVMDITVEDAKKQEAAEKQEKRSSRWGMPKLLPTLSYTAIRRDASNSIASHLPQIIPKSASVGQLPVPLLTARASTSSNPDASPTLLRQPEWRTTANLRGSFASGMSDPSTSAAPSPILSNGVPGFTSAFSSFSFAARQDRTLEEIEEPASPMGSRDSPTFEGPNPFDSASSAGESEVESLPQTPLDASFAKLDGPLSWKPLPAVDSSLTPKALHVHSFAE